MRKTPILVTIVFLLTACGGGGSSSGGGGGNGVYYLGEASITVGSNNVGADAEVWLRETDGTSNLFHFVIGIAEGACGTHPDSLTVNGNTVTVNETGSCNNPLFGSCPYAATGTLTLSGTTLSGRGNITVTGCGFLDGSGYWTATLTRQ